MANYKEHLKTIQAELLESLAKLPEHKLEDLLDIVKSWLSDARTCNRRPYFMDIDYSDDHRREHGMVQNISASGVLIQPAGSLPTGRSIVMTFEHPSMPKHLKLNGKIAWKDHRGMGVHFDQEIESLSEQ